MSLNLLEQKFELEFCQKLEQLGWVKNVQISNDFLIIEEIFKSKLFEINKHIFDRYKIKNNSDPFLVIYDEIKHSLKNINNNKDGLAHLIRGINVSTKLKINGKSIDIIEQFKLIYEYSQFEKNSYSYINQQPFFSNNNKANKMIPDIILFLNGLPISVIELKAPESKQELEDAYRQLRNYLNCNNFLNNFNLFCVVSNLSCTKYGSIDANFNQHWFIWKDLCEKQTIEFEEPVFTSYVGMYHKKIFTNILFNYCHFENNIKIIPKYYQFFATELTVNKLYKIINSSSETSSNDDFKLGYLYHTQGSGKSITMLFLAKRIPQITMRNWKIVFVTDRSELDKQLYKRLEDAKEYFGFSPTHINSRLELRLKIREDDNPDIFTTTIQKFCSDTGQISNKRNIIVIADEAHRSHNETEIREIGKLNDDNSVYIEELESFAIYLNSAFPNAFKFGLTGTPLIEGKFKTSDIFGSEVHRYDMVQAEKDNAIVPLNYELRKIELNLNKKELMELDNCINDFFANSNESKTIENSKRKLIEKKLSKIENIINNDELITKMVKDFWHHYEIRKTVLNGKAMFVALNREIAHKIYLKLKEFNPEYADKIIFVVTSDIKKDSPELQRDIPSKEETNNYAIEFKKADSKYKIAVVVDKWLTGFDVPDLDTLYLCKIIKKHNLLQTIARVNRTYENKELNLVKQHGLIVDYLGISSYIKDALKIYTNINDIDNNFIDINQSIKIVSELVDQLEKWIFNKCEIYSNSFNNNNKESLLEEMVSRVLFLDKDEQDKFFKITKELSKHFDICKQKLSSVIKMKAQYICLTRNIIRKNKVENNIELSQIIQEAKNKLVKCAEVGDIKLVSITDIPVMNLSNLQQIIEEENKKYHETKKINPITIDEIRKKINARLKKLYETNSIASLNLADKLEIIFNKYNSEHNFEEMLKSILQFMKDLHESEQDSLDIPENIRAFYIIFKDQKLPQNEFNSAILREMANEIYNIINKNYSKNWNNNPKIKQRIKVEISKTLKKYNYPPKNEILTKENLFKKIEEYMTKK